MKVATRLSSPKSWQFTALNAFTKKTRPVGHGLSWSTDRFAIEG